MKLFELFLLEFSKLETEIVSSIKLYTTIPFSVRAARTNLTIVLDGAFNGDQAADDFEIASIIEKIKQNFSNYKIVSQYHSKTDSEKPTGLTLYDKLSNKVICKVSFVKKSLKRSLIDGNQKREYKDLRTFSKTSKAGEANEIHFAKIASDILEKQNNPTKIVFKGSTNNTIFEVSDVIKINWVGKNNKKPDIELVTEDGEIINLSIKQRDFFEIDSGDFYRKKNETKIYSAIENSLDNNSIEIGNEGKLSKEKHYELALKLSSTECKTAYFGNAEVSAVIVESFVSNDFKILNNELHVNCDYVLTSTSDIHDRIWPYASINSDFEKNEKYSTPILGKMFLSIIPRFRLSIHDRKSLPAKTKVIE